MIEALAQVNWLAVSAASVANFVLGGLWFGAVVGKRYAAVLGIADRPTEKPGPLFFAGPFFCSAVTILATAILLSALGVTGYGDALALGALVGFGYLAPMTLNIAINPLFPRPFAYALINAPFFIGGSLLSSAILVAFG